MGWLQGLRERKLFQWALAYCAAAWALIEVVDFLTSRFTWPEVVVRTLTVILAFGIPVVLVLAWFHGERGTQRVSALELSLLTLLFVGAGVGAYAVRGNGESTSLASRPEDDGSVAVVPFRNLSADPEQKYFSDGFTDELSVALAAEGLPVVAPSAFVFEGTRENVRELALDLSARYLLEGSIMRAAEEVRVNAFLVTTGTGRQVWAGRYEARLSPATILSVQEQIARAIVTALRLKLAPEVRPAAGSLGTTSQEAYDAYLRGLGALAQVTRESYDSAAQAFGRAIELDPSFARARSGLAFANVGWWLPRPEERERKVTIARTAARRALELDSTLAEPHVVFAQVAYLDGDTAEQRRQLEIAIRKEPTARWPHYFMASVYFEAGDRVRALAQTDTLLAIDPTSPWAHIMALNWRALAGELARADSAAARAQQLIAMGFGPQPTWALHWNLGYLAFQRRDYERAGAEFAKGFPSADSAMAATIAGFFSAIAAIQRSPRGAEERRQAALAVVRNHEQVLGRQLILFPLYLQFGDKERAYATLEKAVAEGNSITVGLASFDPIRSEPRFQELVKRSAR